MERKNLVKNKKVFTGDIEIYHKCKNHLLDKGFIVYDAIHIGNNKYEFQEKAIDFKEKGHHILHTILVQVIDGEVVYKSKEVGWLNLD